MVNVSELASKIFGALKGNGCNVKIFNDMGNEIFNTDAGRIFYSYDPNLLLRIDEEDKKITISLGNTLELKDTEKLQSTVKNLANQYLYNYSVRQFSKHIQPKDFSHEIEAKKEKMNESISQYKNKTILEYNNVKLHVNHKNPVVENDHTLSRNIKSMYIESNGEKYKFPIRNLSAAKAAAKHISEGGEHNDSLYSYIIESAQRQAKLKEFLKYVKVNNLLNETTNDIVNSLKSEVSSIKVTLEGLSKPKMYFVLKERILVHDITDVLYEEDTNQIKELFTVRSFNEQFEDLLPYIGKCKTNRQKFIEHVSLASSVGVPLIKPLLNDESLYEFVDEKSKLHYRITNLIECLKDEYLKKYTSEVLTRLNENTINEFDITVIRNILENCFVDSNDIQINESIEDKYLDTIKKILA